MIIEQADLHSEKSDLQSDYRTGGLVIIEQADLQSDYRTGGIT